MTAIDRRRLPPDAAHEILREADGPREHAMRAIDGFLDARAPGR